MVCNQRLFGFLEMSMIEVRNTTERIFFCYNPTKAMSTKATPQLSSFIFGVIKETIENQATDLR